MSCAFLTAFIFSSILAAGQPVKKPLLNGHDKLAEPVVKPKEKSRKVKKTSAEMLNDLLAVRNLLRNFSLS